MELYETSPVGLCWVNENGAIVAMNHTLLNWLGYSRDEVIDRMTLDGLVSEGTRRQLHELRERCQRGKAIEEADLTLRCNDGNRWFQAKVNAVGVHDAQGTYRGWRGSVRDGTWEREIRRQLLQMQTLGAIERLAEGISHELNNLLQVIVGYADLGLEQLDHRERRTSDLLLIKEAAFRAAAIVQRLRAFSPRSILEKRSLDLNEVIRDLAPTLRSLLPENIELRLATSTERAVVFADAGTLNQLLISLVSSARGAIPSGGTLFLETSHVRFDEVYCQRHPATKPGAYVCLTETGMEAGTDPASLTPIFEPILSTADPGAGLRLSPLWGIVKQHDAHVEVFSSSEDGTVVRMYVPCERS
jgi:PAS domain S-box-containing protein